MQVAPVRKGSRVRHLGRWGGGRAYRQPLRGTVHVQAVAALQANASDFGIASIYYKGNGIEMFGDPTVDIRVPDIAIKVQPGEHAALRALCMKCWHVFPHRWDGAGDRVASHKAVSRRWDARWVLLCCG